MTRRSKLASTVLDQIKHDNVAVKPRWHFTALITIGVLASLAAAYTIAHLTTIANMLWRIATASTPAYGARRNVAELWAEFPWWALILAAALTVLGIWLLRNYGRLYRYNLAAVLAGFIGISIIIGLFMSATGIGTVNEINGGQPQMQGRGRWQN